MDRITLTQPDDWHLHVRDGDALRAVLPYSARQFGRAIIMPNLVPPVTTTEQALAYRERILAALPEGSAFEPLMTLYLTDNTPPEEILRAKASGHVHAVKLYPAGATTTYTYDEAGRLTSVTDPTGATYRIQCDAAGLPVQITDPLGAVLRYERDAFGRVATFVDPVGGVTRYTYNPEGRLVARLLPDGASETWRYDAEGNLIEHVDVLGQATRFEVTHFDGFCYSPMDRAAVKGILIDDCTVMLAILTPE